MAMGRTLYPHKKLPDAVYALLAKDLDGKADPALRAGIKALDEAAGGSFAKANAAKRLQVVKAIEGTAFFNTVRGQCVTSLTTTTWLMRSSATQVRPGKKAATSRAASRT